MPGKAVRQRRLGGRPVRRRQIAISVAVALGCVCIVACGGTNPSPTGPRTSSVGSPSPPVPSPVNASSTPELPTLAPPGPLAPGIHLSDQFAVAFTYTIGEGWIVSEDDPDYFALSRVATPDGEIELSYDVYPPGSVPALFNHSVPHAGADVIDGIRAEPCFATLVSPTSVGGLTGSALTVTVGADAACEDRSLYVIRWSDGMPMTIAVGPGGTYDLDVLDDGAGHALVLEITGDAAFRALSSTVIDTFRFQLPAS